MKKISTNYKALKWHDNHYLMIIMLKNVNNWTQAPSAVFTDRAVITPMKQVEESYSSVVKTFFVLSLVFLLHGYVERRSGDIETTP